MVWFVLLLISSLLGWGMVFICLRKSGCNWVMISGIYGEEKQKYRDKHDVVALNRYAGKSILLPTAIMITMTLPMPLDFAWSTSAWYGILIGICAVASMVRIFIAIPQMLGTRFEKNHNN